MTSAHDPLHEPLRLLREASLPAGFEERLAEHLAAAQQRGNVVRFPGRKGALLLVAAIAMPALAAAAGGYYMQRRASATSSESVPQQVEARPLGHLPKTGFTVTVPRTEPAMPAIERLSAPRSQEPSRPSNSAPKAEERRPNGPEPEMVVSPPAANAAPRIEALDPFVANSTTSKQSAATPKAADGSESLRKATEQGAARTTDDSARGSRRDANANENRGNDAAQQARERVQARERKGQ
jgi:hypothetical protein